jgi:hypothetical protein
MTSSSFAASSGMGDERFADRKAIDSLPNGNNVLCRTVRSFYRVIP